MTSGTPAADVDVRTSPPGKEFKLAPSDPPLAALAVSTDNGFIEFIRGSDGRVIQEIDQNPSSLGFKKPTREYTYSGDKVVGLTVYEYLGDHVQVTRTSVAYKLDGSIDQYRESTIDMYPEKSSVR